MKTMHDISYNRIALVGGIGTLLLFPAIALIGFPTIPPVASPDQEFAAYFVANQASVVAVVLLVAFHALTRLTFIAGLCAVLRQAEGGGAPLTGLALACGAVEATIEIIGYTLLGTAARLAGRGADPGVLGALGSATRDLISLHAVPLALFTGLASVVILRTGVLPRWIGWLGLAAGVLYEGTALQFVLPLAALSALRSVAVFLLFIPWMIASGVVSFRRARAQAGRPAAQVQATPV